MFVLLFLGILLIALNFLYKQGRITSDKMEMQNAADAAAYSVSITEARDLNFAAYLNRAMVANEVAIGQLMGLASWAFHWASFADFLMFYDSIAIGPATLGISTPIIQTLSNAIFRIPGQIFIRIMSALGKFGTALLHLANKFYGLAQYGYHLVSGLYSAASIFEVMEQNAPEGTRVSEFGVASLIAHFASYGALPLPVPGGTFTESYSPTKVTPKADYESGDKGSFEGYERFAALVRDSGDPFTAKRGWKFGLFTLPPIADVINDNGGGVVFVDTDPDSETYGTINFDWSDGFDIDLGLVSGGVNWRIFFYFGMNLAREGGSELRLVLPGPAAGYSGQGFNWSSADTTVLEVLAGGGFNLNAYAELDLGVLGEVTLFDLSLGAEIHVRNEELKVSMTLPVVGTFDLLNTPFPTSAPFGAAFTEAGTVATNNMRMVPQMTPSFMGGQVSDEAYGGAAKRRLAWMSTPPAPLGIMMQSNLDADHMIYQSYRGLPRYIDTTGNESTLFGFGAPFILISLVLDESDYDKARDGSGDDHPEMTGQSGAYNDLKLEEKFANEQLHSTARAEVYFKRPNDLSYFARADGLEEHGSAFNPYWNARLSSTRYVDRIVAALVQQQQDFTGTSEIFDLIEGGLCDLLPGGC